VRDLLIRDFRHKWCSDSEVVSESRARESKLAARDRRQGDDTDLDGIDAPGLERRVTETSAAIRDYTTVTIEHESSTEDDRSTNRKRENRRRGYWNRKQRRVDLTPTEVGATISIARTTSTSNITTTLRQRTRQAGFEAWRSHGYTLRPSRLRPNTGIGCHFRLVQARRSFLALT